MPDSPLTQPRHQTHAVKLGDVNVGDVNVGDVNVGGVVVGGGHPVVVQSMTNTDTADAAATASRSAELARPAPS
jgi:4-hydroxy-3-methylbut-2-en-1-yl diphosphate synthase IspG/GcpE